MVRSLSITGSKGFSFAIQDHSGLPFFDQFADLLSVAALSEEVEFPVARLKTDLSADDGGMEIFASSGRKLRLVIADDGTTPELIVAPDKFSIDSVRMKIWQSLTVCAGIGAVLHGAPMVLMHGAVLIDYDGKAFLLCAESGVGKSTTSRRWQMTGGNFAADDMFLLEYDKSSDGFFAYALPTWSRCRISPEPVRFPASRPFPVAGILGLSRGNSGDVIEEVSSVDFWGQILRSSCYHTKEVVRYLPDDLKQRFSRQMAAAVGSMVDVFPPCGLFADLNGDLKAAIEYYRRNFMLSTLR